MQDRSRSSLHCSLPAISQAGQRKVQRIHAALYIAVKAFVETVKQAGMEQYEFAVHETTTYDVLENVKNFRSEIGVLYLNDFNEKS